MLEFCEETLNIAKKIVLTSTGLIDQVGGLYLLYGLYYKIPLENIKIRVTVKEWQTFLDLHKLMREGKLHDASYIFVNLAINNAFHLCIHPTEVNYFISSISCYPVLEFQSFIVSVWFREKLQDASRTLY